MVRYVITLGWTEFLANCCKSLSEAGINIESIFMMGKSGRNVDIALGGDDTLENVRPAHGLCNLTKQPKGEDVNV